MTIKEEIKEIEGNVKRLMGERKEIESQIKMFQSLLREKYAELYGKDSIVTQMKIDVINYELLPDYLKIYRKKKI